MCEICRHGIPTGADFNMEMGDRLSNISFNLHILFLLSTLLFGQKSFTLWAYKERLEFLNINLLNEFSAETP